MFCIKHVLILFNELIVIQLITNSNVPPVLRLFPWPLDPLKNYIKTNKTVSVKLLESSYQFQERFPMISVLFHYDTSVFAHYSTKTNYRKEISNDMTADYTFIEFKMILYEKLRKFIQCWRKTAPKDTKKPGVIQNFPMWTMTTKLIIMKKNLLLFACVRRK